MMSNWLNDTRLDWSKEAAPLYKQLTDSLLNLIQSGKIKHGSNLPPVRELAKMIGVNRGTVLTAYRKLSELGYLQMHVGRGTKVKMIASTPPFADLRSEVSIRAQRLSSFQPNAGLMRNLYSELSFASATPAKEAIPSQTLLNSLQTIFQRGGEPLLSYGSVHGEINFRQSVAQYMKTFGLNLDPDWILPINGCTQAWDLVAKLLLNPDDLVLLEEPGYSGAFQAFSLLPVKIEFLPMQKDGVSVDALREIISQRKTPRLVCLNPDFQSPTGFVLSLEKRKALAQLAREHRFFILEDTVFSELYYDQDLPNAPIASFAPERVILAYSFSKTLAPGLRLGLLISHPSLIEHISQIKKSADYHANLISQEIVHELMRSGFWSEHLQTIRALYRHKRDVTQEALQASMPTDVSWEIPGGGFFFWLELPMELDSQELLFFASQKKVSFTPGILFSRSDKYRSFLRLSFSDLQDKRIATGIKILAEATKKLSDQIRTSIPHYAVI